MYSRVLNIGIKHVKSDFEKNNVVLTNFAFGLGLAISLAFCLYLIVNADFFNSVFIGFGSLLCFIGLYFNHIGKYTLAIISACSITGVLIPISIWFQGNNGMVAYLIPSTVIVSFLSAEKPVLKRSLIIYTLFALGVSINIIIFKHNGIKLAEGNRFIFMGNVMAAISGTGMAISYFSSLLNEQQKRLQQLVEVKNKMLAVLAHDLRGPLNNMIQIFEMLESDDINETTSQKLLIKASKEVKNTTYLLNDVLIWVRSQMTGIEPDKVIFKIDELALRIVNDLKLKAEMKGIELTANLSEHKIYADKDMIALAIRNLVSNAIKYVPSANGKIDVEISDNGANVEIHIKDNGPGLSEADIEKISNSLSFTKQGSQNEKGFGIGLLLTSEFIKQNDGNLSVKNNASGGAHFTFTLPKP